jgi:hypothetical protein
MNNIREAILKAADFIERHPNQYEWTSILVPGFDGSGCMLGWISYFMGKVPYSGIQYEIEPGVTQSLFYGRINSFGVYCSNIDGTTAPTALRKYAAKFHPIELRPVHEVVNELIAELSNAEPIPEEG